MDYQRYAVIGHPIAQSLSPVIHQAFAKQCGLSLSYEAILGRKAAFAEDVQAFIAQGGCGLNVTVPFKMEAFHFATMLSPRAQFAQAVNTLLFLEQGIYGDNTDGIGLVTDLCERLQCDLAGQPILLFGAGGAARGVIHPLLEKKPSVLVLANRTESKAEQCIAQFVEVAGETTLLSSSMQAIPNLPYSVIINATASSLYQEAMALPDWVWQKPALFYDMVYQAQPTIFLRQAMQNGAQQTADGLGMLVEQAAAAFTLWTGVKPRTAPVFAQLRHDLLCSSM